MKRCLFTVLSVLSLLLCASVCVLWASSHRANHCWWFQRGWQNPEGSVGNRNLGVCARLGQLDFFYEQTRLSRRIIQDGTIAPLEWEGFHHFHTAEAPPTAVEPPLHGWRWAGFQFDNYRSTHNKNYLPTKRGVGIVLPCWFLMAVTLLGPAAWAWRIRRLRARPRFGLCINFGYDLRASPERCPECGKLAQVRA